MMHNVKKEIPITCLTSIEEAMTHTQESGYTICMPDNVWGGVKLLQSGWYFADRILYTAISLTKWEMRMPTESRGKYHYAVTDDWDVEEIYHIASGFFQKECRFAMDREKADETLKNRLLAQYLRQRREDGYLATCCYAGCELVGFNLWRLLEGKGRIVLGAVQKNYQQTGLAVYLYGRTIRAMREGGADTLADRISTANMASLNLHTRLAQGGGIRFTKAEDWYVKSWSNSKRNF